MCTCADNDHDHSHNCHHHHHLHRHHCHWYHHQHKHNNYLHNHAPSPITKQIPTDLDSGNVEHDKSRSSLGDLSDPTLPKLEILAREAEVLEERKLRSRDELNDASHRQGAKLGSVQRDFTQALPEVRVGGDGVPLLAHAGARSKKLVLLHKVSEHPNDNVAWEGPAVTE